MFAIETARIWQTLDRDDVDPAIGGIALAGTDGLVAARNGVAAQLLASDCDWLLWLDTDMGFAPDSLTHVTLTATEPKSQREILLDGVAGPREAVMHMIVRKNFGATHFVVGRDMAGTKSTRTGEDFYGPYDAQEAARKVATELAMKVVTYENMVYTDKGFLEESKAAELKVATKNLSGTKFRAMLRAGDPIPEWFSFKSVINVLRKTV
jgi:hypothetical protein